MAASPRSERNRCRRYKGKRDPGKAPWVIIWVLGRLDPKPARHVKDIKQCVFWRAGRRAFAIQESVPAGPNHRRRL